MTCCWRHDEPFDVLTYFWRNGDIFDVMTCFTHFLMSWRISDVMKHDVMTNCLVSWRVFGVMTCFTHFLTSWRVYTLFDVMTYFWRHEALFDVMTSFWRHDELFGVVMCFWHHDVFFTSGDIFSLNLDVMALSLTSWLIFFVLIDDVKICLMLWRNKSSKCPPNKTVEISSFKIERNELKFELTEWSYFNFIGRGITDLFRRSRKHEYAVQHDEPVRSVI